MELFGVTFSIPVALVANILYCFFLDRVVLKFERASRWLRFMSYFALGFFVGELVMLFTLGTVRSRAILGPKFNVAHVIVFFISVPALANSLILAQHRESKERRDFLGMWYIAAALCTILSFFLLLMQYRVSESLYGIE